VREIRTLRSKWRGAGNPLTVWLVRHSQRKRGETARLNLRCRAPVLDLLRKGAVKFERSPIVFEWVYESDEYIFRKVARQAADFSDASIPEETVLHFGPVLSKMFKTAIKWRWLVENPAREIEAPPTRVKRQQRALSVEEVSLLFDISWIPPGSL